MRGFVNGRRVSRVVWVFLSVNGVLGSCIKRVGRFGWVGGDMLRVGIVWGSGEEVGRGCD